jgi:hypothetical protein
VAGGVIAFYQLGYGIVAFGVAGIRFVRGEPTDVDLVTGRGSHPLWAIAPTEAAGKNRAVSTNYLPLSRRRRFTGR